MIVETTWKLDVLLASIDTMRWADETNGLEPKPGNAFINQS